MHFVDRQDGRAQMCTDRAAAFGAEVERQITVSHAIFGHILSE
jgi:hypothetical protein